MAHFKDKDPETGDTTKTVKLGQSLETSQPNYLQEISSFVHVKTNREKGSDYKKIELFWPHSLLKVGDSIQRLRINYPQFLVLIYRYNNKRHCI